MKSLNARKAERAARREENEKAGLTYGPDATNIAINGEPSSAEGPADGSQADLTNGNGGDATNSDPSPSVAGAQARAAKGTTAEQIAAAEKVKGGKEAQGNGGGTETTGSAASAEGSAAPGWTGGK